MDSSIDVSAKRYRYTGMERDEETGLAYHSARYYASWLGRWTASDPIGLGDGPNRHAYVNACPTTLSDIGGTQATTRATVQIDDNGQSGVMGYGESSYEPPLETGVHGGTFDVGTSSQPEQDQNPGNAGFDLENVRPSAWWDVATNPSVSENPRNIREHKNEHRKIAMHETRHADAESAADPFRYAVSGSPSPWFILDAKATGKIPVPQVGDGEWDNAVTDNAGKIERFPGVKNPRWTLNPHLTSSRSGTTEALTDVYISANVSFHNPRIWAKIQSVQVRSWDLLPEVHGHENTHFDIAVLVAVFANREIEAWSPVSQEDYDALFVHAQMVHLLVQIEFDDQNSARRASISHRKIFRKIRRAWKMSDAKLLKRLADRSAHLPLGILNQFQASVQKREYIPHDTYK
ncbi:MAG: RHS repeat-associated core domain-containing protein [Deltaproteobacteria bacterium]|nr:RHS repeat-associated core domain-containing protein [Deltaproteobacteria bacterium]